MQNETIRDWRRGASPQPKKHCEFSKLFFNVSVSTAPLFTAARLDGTRKEQYENKNLCVFYPMYPHQEATRKSLFSFTNEISKTLLRRVFSQYKNRISLNIFLKMSQTKLLDLSKKAKNLYRVLAQLFCMHSVVESSSFKM